MSALLQLVYGICGFLVFALTMYYCLDSGMGGILSTIITMVACTALAGIFVNIEDFVIKHTSHGANQLAGVIVMIFMAGLLLIGWGIIGRHKLHPSTVIVEGLSF